jgi:hypothetical protein
VLKSFWHRTVIGLLSLGGLICGSAQAALVTFDDLTLAPESYWNGPDPAGANYPDPWGGSLPVAVGSFTSGTMAFNNSFNANYASWGGFAYSNTSDQTTPGYMNQFSAITGTGHGPGADNYGVAFGYTSFSAFPTLGDLEGLPNMSLPTGAEILGAFVTNTTYATLSMRNGDQFAKKFGGASGTDADWFQLTAYGVDAAGNVLPDTSELYLADYRFATSAQDYILDKWTFLDLSPLKDAARIYFNVTSSDVGNWGMNTPGYFAIDDISYTTSTAPVPEPGSLLLALIGGGALVYSRYRRRTTGATGPLP